MRLKDVIRLTGLTKRTIYFYIEEQFLSPEVDPTNGYYNFSEDDVARLKILQQLRKADFSIKDIHSILKHPTSAYIYIKKQMEHLQREQELLIKKINSLQKLYDQLPILVSREEFCDAVFQIDFPDTTPSFSSDLNSDVNLLSLYLWIPFLDGVPMTEYRKYLWDKILHETSKVSAQTLTALKEHLYSLSAEQLDQELQLRTKHIKNIASLTEATMPAFVKESCQQIDHLSKNLSFAHMWKRDYHGRIKTTTQLYDSDFNNLMTELSPLFSSYYENIHICCDQIYDWLHTSNGHSVLTRLNDHLGDCLDLQSLHHAEIAALLSIGITMV